MYNIFSMSRPVSLMFSFEKYTYRRLSTHIFGNMTSFLTHTKPHILSVYTHIFSYWFQGFLQDFSGICLRIWNMIITGETHIITQSGPQNGKVTEIRIKSRFKWYHFTLIDDDDDDDVCVYLTFIHTPIQIKVKLLTVFWALHFPPRAVLYRFPTWPFHVPSHRVIFSRRKVHVRTFPWYL